VIRRVLLVTAFAAGLAAVAVAATGRSPRTRTVEVSDTALEPATTAIGPGDSVAWLDTGRHSHRVTSDNGTWKALVLRPKQGATVTFPRIGTYHYHVDGRRKGIVQVKVVVVRPPSASASNGEQWTGSFRSDGIVVGTGQTCSATWTGTVRFTVTTKGKVSGTGKASMSNPACSVKLPSPEASRVTFTIGGLETWDTTGTWLRLVMHPLTVTPPGYDAGGFLLHFGKRGEGIPLDLPVVDGKVNARVFKQIAGANSTVTLDDRFVLSLG
jgi:plastocyanin